MQILIISHYFAHGPAYDLEEFLRGRGVRYTAVYMPLYKWQRERRVVVKMYDGRSLLATRINPPAGGSSKTINTLIGLIEALGADYDVCIGEDPLSAYMCILLRRVGRAVLAVFHSHNFIAPERGRPYRLVDETATRLSDAVWCLSRRLCRIRSRLGARLVVHVPVGIQPRIIQVLRSGGKDGLVGVYVGRLDVDKGVDVLAAAMPMLARLLDEVYIIGDGVLRRLVERVAEGLPNVKFTGPLPLQAAARLISRSMIGFTLSRPTLEVLTTDPLKPKLYLAASTPTIIPWHLELAVDVRRLGAGVVIRDIGVRGVVEAARSIIRRAEEACSAAGLLARSKGYWSTSLIFKEAFRALGVRV